MELLQPYPFERLSRLLAGSSAAAGLKAVNLSIGEPRHAAPECVKQALIANLDGLSSYPATLGQPALREAMAAWLQRRYGVSVDPARHVLPVLGSREALFAFAQVALDGQAGSAVVCPNPFYQIYEGAALLAGCEPVYVNSVPEQGFEPDWAAVPDTVWQRTRLLFVCTPGNPAGNIMSLDTWRRLFELADRHDFVIASDECYSEIYPHGAEPPMGGLTAAARLGRTGFERLMVFSSLSKRSNVPGLRSGLVAGDASLIARFLKYRTYHGSAMSPVVQAASMAAWNDEAHVIENRQQYQAKFDAVLPILAPVLDVQRPSASFYLWAATPVDDLTFTRELLVQQAVQVLPGSFLARDTAQGNPGAGRIRIALVAPLADCIEGAHRIASLARTIKEHA